MHKLCLSGLTLRSDHFESERQSDSQLEFTVQLLSQMVPNTFLTMLKQHGQRELGLESKFNHGNKKLPSLNSYLQRPLSSQSHVCDHKTCNPINESRAIRLGHLPLQHRIRRDDVFLCNCGTIHVCYQGGDVVSPCIVDMSYYRTTKKMKCKITNRLTLLPPSEFFDTPSFSHSTPETSKDIISKFVERHKGASETKKVAFLGRSFGDDLRKRKREPSPARDVMNGKDVSNIATNNCLDIEGYLNVKDTIAPFNSTMIAPQNPSKTLSKRNKNARNLGQRSGNRRAGFTKINGGGGNKRRKKHGILRGQPTRSNLSTMYCVDNADGKLGGDYYSKTDPIIKTDRITNVSFPIFTEGNYNGDETPYIVHEDEVVFAYFSKPSNNAQSNMLFSKASNNYFFGTKEERLQESIEIATKLFYSPERQRRLQAANLNKQLRCSKELYQHYVSTVEACKASEGVPHIDLMDYLPIVAKHYGPGLELHAKEVEEALKIKNEKFLRFFSELCWLQWAVVCASPHGIGSHMKYNRVPVTSEEDKLHNRKKVLSTAEIGANYSLENCINFTNCCLSVLYDMIGGQIVGKSKVVIPKVHYVSKYAPPITDITKYGFRKKMLTCGISQRTMAYTSLFDQHQFELLCKFDFKNIE